MAANRDATRFLKTGVVRKLRSEFSHNRVPGITETPLIIQDRPLNSVPYPYIYIDVVDVSEIDITKDISSYDYLVRVQIVNKTTQQSDGKSVRDAISDEVTHILDVDTDNYIDLLVSGFNNTIQTVESINPLPPTNTFGATYWVTEVDVRFRIDFVGTPQTIDPVQNANFVFSNFAFIPNNNRIEMFDAGLITGDTTYPSNNRGWNFTAVDYALTTGADGTLINNDYTVGADDDNLGLITTIDYEFADDTSITTQITDTDVFSRIKSLRFGVTNDTNITTARLRNLAEWNIRFGTVNPDNQQITIDGDIGDHLYIIVDDSHSITSILDTVQTENIRNFNVTIMDGYRIYISRQQVQFDGSSFNFTLHT